jgi:hypothetical protein
MLRYPYCPFEDASNNIRLLSHLPAASDGTLRFSLSHQRLLPQLSYDALSYEWGECKVQKVILVDDHPVHIYANLHSFLFHLQQYHNTQLELLPFFADALSIDQLNIAERNVQVQSMGRIYKQATKVLAWLGEASSGSDFLFDALNAHYDRLLSWDGVDVHKDWVSDFIDSSEFEQKQETVASMNEIYMRRYWGRL